MMPAVSAIRRHGEASACVADDLTLLFYTANRIAPRFLQAALAVNVTAAGARPWVVIAQQPLDQVPPCALEVIVSEQTASAYNVYRQILSGARYARTTYVACVEDDSLYSAEHFTYRPAPGVFAYNRNRWVLTRIAGERGRRVGRFYWRERTQMAQCICERELLIETLEERFAKYPTALSDAQTFSMGWGEPGRYERNLKLTPRRREYFNSVIPNVTFNHSESIRGRRAMKDTDTIVETLPPWGNATALWERIHG